MSSIQFLRENIRNIARRVKKQQKTSLQEEVKLRRYIRKLLREIEEISPHDSTGVNVLEDLLKTIVPIIEAGYKRLTSDVQQRESFRAHIIRAVQNLLSTESIYFSIDKKKEPASMAGDLTEQDDLENDSMESPEDPAFIDIDKEKKAKEKKDSKPKPEDAFVSLEGEDPTGRGFALKSFEKIQKQILDSYSLLGKDDDREIFYDYLITNLKLYFDKFEDELQKKIEEPTTDAYEAEKQKKADSLPSSGKFGGDETGGEEPEPEEGEAESEQEPVEPGTM